jgi:hypothetical protein
VGFELAGLVSALAFVAGELSTEGSSARGGRPMAQTFLRIVVDGFHADEFDFAAALQRKPGADIAAFDDFISAGASTEERRARELDASRQRMESAGTFVLTRFADALSSDGFPTPTTFDDPTNVGFCFVKAGAADLVNLVPATEAEREQNRRVKFLAIQFSAQAQPLTFGEQNLDRSVA